MSRRLALVVAALVAAALPAVAETGGGSGASSGADAGSGDAAALARVRAIAASLAALETSGDAGVALEAELATALRSRCGADPSAASWPCALATGRAVCEARPANARASCAAAADVVLVNLRAASDWVDEATRVRLVRGATDYHRALLSELERRFAALAAELVLEERTLAAELGERAGASSAAVLDRFCARRDYRPRPPRCQAAAATCVPPLSWQRCVAALVWAISRPSPSVTSGADR